MTADRPMLGYGEPTSRSSMHIEASRMTGHRARCAGGGRPCARAALETWADDRPDAGLLYMGQARNRRKHIPSNAETGALLSEARKPDVDRTKTGHNPVFEIEIPILSPALVVHLIALSAYTLNRALSAFRDTRRS